MEEAGRETLQLRHSVSLSTTDIETIKKTIGLRLHSASLVMQLLPQLLAISIEVCGIFVVSAFEACIVLKICTGEIGGDAVSRASKARNNVRCH